MGHRTQAELHPSILKKKDIFFWTSPMWLVHVLLVTLIETRPTILPIFI